MKARRKNVQPTMLRYYTNALPNTRGLVVKDNCIMETTNQSLEKALTILANKLGTTVEHIWGVLVRQAFIDGVKSCIYTIFLLIALAICLKMFTNPWIKHKEERKGGGYSNIDPDAIIVFGCILCLCVVLIAAIFCLSSNAIDCFYNPEYWALKEIIK